MVHILDINSDDDIPNSPQIAIHKCLPLHAQFTHIRWHGALHTEVHCFDTSYWVIMSIFWAWKWWSWVELDNESWCFKFINFILFPLGGHHHLLVKFFHSWENLYYWGDLIGVMCPYHLPWIKFSICHFFVVISFGLVVTCVPKSSMLHNPMRIRGLKYWGWCNFIRKNYMEREKKTLIQNGKAKK